MSEITTKRPKSTEHVPVHSGLTLPEIRRRFPRLQGLATALAESRSYSFAELLSGFVDRLRSPGYDSTRFVGESHEGRLAAAAARSEFLACMAGDAEAPVEALRGWLARAKRELDRTDARELRTRELSEIALVVENLLDFSGDPSCSC